SIAATSCLTAIALVLVFTSSLAVCCVCMRFAGRKRYKPASPDELNRVILPVREKNPTKFEEHPGNFPIGQLLTRLSMQRKKPELTDSKKIKTKNDLLPKQQPSTDCRIYLGNRCYDNNGFYSDLDVQHCQPFLGVPNVSTLSNGKPEFLVTDPIYNGLLSQSNTRCAYPRQNPRTLQDAYRQSKETEL
ncbi:hypothetical protein BOX15_Mlig015452g1, partial [Macrostomum lignano]